MPSKTTTAKTAVSLVEKLLGPLIVSPDPNIYADLRLVPKEFAQQAGFLRRRNLLRKSETLLVFYNSALVSPSGDDKTNTCVFLTDKRIVDVVSGYQRRSHAFGDIEDIQVEHRWKLAQDSLVIHLRDGHTSLFDIPRERVANQLRRLALRMVEHTRLPTTEAS